MSCCPLARHMRIAACKLTCAELKNAFCPSILRLTPARLILTNLTVFCAKSMATISYRESNDECKDE